VCGSLPGKEGGREGEKKKGGREERTGIFSCHTSIPTNRKTSTPPRMLLSSASPRYVFPLSLLPSFFPSLPPAPPEHALEEMNENKDQKEYSPILPASLPPLPPSSPPLSTLPFIKLWGRSTKNGSKGHTSRNYPSWRPCEGWREGGREERREGGGEER